MDSGCGRRSEHRVVVHSLIADPLADEGKWVPDVVAFLTFFDVQVGRGVR